MQKRYKSRTSKVTVGVAEVSLEWGTMIAMMGGGTTLDRVGVPQGRAIKTGLAGFIGELIGMAGSERFGGY